MNPADSPHEPALPPPKIFFIGAGALAGFFLFWSWFVSVRDMDSFDLVCARYWHDWSEGHRSVWNMMVYLTDLGSIAAMTLMAIMGSIWQTAIRHRVLAVAWLGAVIGG